MATLSPNAVPRRENLSLEEFDRCYARKNLPVILVGALNEWPALEKWTPEFFAENYQERQVLCRGAVETTTMDAYISKLSQSSAENPLIYLRNLNIQTDFPELVQDITPRLRYATPDWLSSPLMPQDWLRPNNLNQLFISGASTRITLHYDDWMTHNMVSNVFGSKRFVLFDQAQSEHLYRRGYGDDYIISQVDPWDFSAEQFPDYNQATGYEVTIDKGDTLFVPAGWWHSSYTTSTCISVSSSFANGSNWPALIAEISRLRDELPTLKSKCKTIAIRSYLKTVGMAMGIR